MDTFVQNEMKWRSSAICFTVTELYLVTTIIGPCAIFLLSFIRFRLAANPLHSIFREVTCCRNYVSRTILGGLLCITALSIVIKTQTKALPSIFCTPNKDPTNSITIVYYATWILGFHQVFTAVIICLCHFILTRKILESAKVTMPGGGAKSVSSSLFVQLIVISLSDVFSWLPPNIIFILTLYLPRYPPTLIPWSFVVLCSLNKVITPAVFIAASLKSIYRSYLNKKQLRNIPVGSWSSQHQNTLK